VFSAISLLLVITPLGKDVNGVRAWFQLPGGFTLQPSEFAKLAIVIGMAIVLAETPHRDGIPGNREVILSLGVAALPVALIMLQPDLGTVLVIGAVTLAVLSVSGVASRWLLGLGGGAVVAGWAMVQFGLLGEYQLNRLLVFLNPNIDPLDAGYNILQVRLAIGSGGLSGTGLFNGPQTNGRWVPEQQTDFIYSAVGEELGFIGGATIIILLLIVSWRAFKIAGDTSDRFGKIAASGVAAWIAFQAFENIGMNLGIMPITGVPLPFISYGGSSIFAIWMAVGLLQNIKIKQSD
jgi:rod shape determining protein RodA